VTPETVDANHERMYAFLSPKIYAAFVAELHREAVLIKTEKVTSSFAMISMHTNPKTLTSQITGIVTRSIGEERLPGVLATYTIRYHYSMGHLSMTEFTHTEGEAHE
jgi:type IV conjugative transfer system protein TraE